MKEIPILLSTPMVQAILEGRKTVTRRIVKDIEPESKFLPEFKLSGFTFIEPDQFEKPDSEKIASIITCRYGQPGDLLWVRESWQIAHQTIFYRADGTAQDIVFKWKPSIHLKKEHSRIWLQVEEIRVERLNDISEEDAISEGIFPYYDEMVSGTRFTFQFGQLSNSFTAKEEFEKLWCKINGRESWDCNPWVWVVKYKILSTTGKPEPETRNP